MSIHLPTEALALAQRCLDRAEEAMTASAEARERHALLMGQAETAIACGDLADARYYLDCANVEAAYAEKMLAHVQSGQARAAGLMRLVDRVTATA